MPSRLSETLIWPVLATIAVGAVSALLGVLRVRDVVVGSVCLSILFACLFGVQYLAARHSSRDTRDALFNVLASVAMSDHRTQARTGILTEAEVLALESAADRVWVYAYDLEWEGEGSPFVDVVRSNISRGAEYRYLIPDAVDIQIRASHLLSNRLNPAGTLTIRTTKRERTVTQFGLAIYNPTLLNPEHTAEAVAVFFPHFNFGVFEGVSTTPFLAVRGTAVARLQEAFHQSWAESQELNHF